MLRLRTFTSRFAVIIMAGIPLLVLLGWVMNNPFLMRVLPQFTPMNPTTAVLFLMTAVSLYILNTSIEQKRSPWLMITGGLMLIVGGAMLVKYAGGIDIHIDRLLFESKLGINRMAFATSLNFFLLGLVFCLYPLQKLFSFFFKITIFLISIYAVVAYLYNFIGIYGATVNNPIAIHTAFLFIVVSVYLIAYDSWWANDTMRMLTERKWLTPIVLGLIFIISLTVTGGVASLVDGSLKKQSELRFENQTDQITSFIQSRMNLYINAVYGFQGLYAGSESIEKSEWDAFIDAIDVPVHYSGISGISYALKVDQEQAKKLPVKIYPYTVKDTYYPFIYTTTFVAGSSTPTGFDISSETERNKTLQKSIDDNMPRATPVVLAATTLVPVFSVYAPTFDHDMPLDTIEQRRAAVSGIISISFRTQKIFPDLLSNPLVDKKIDVEIFDTISVTPETAEDKLLFDTNIGEIHESKEEVLTRTGKVSVADRTWTIKFTSNSELYMPVLERYGSLMAFIFGFIFSVLVTLFAAVYIRSRERALLSKNVQLEALVQNFPYGVLIEDENRNLILGNMKVIRTFGIVGEMRNYVGISVPKALEMIKSIVKDFDEFRKRDAQIVEKGNVVADEKIELSNGTFISRSYIPLFYADKMHGAVWIYKDITEEQQIDRMKTEFVSLASHQLRTPLTSIKWYTELMNDQKNGGKLTSEQKEYVKEIGDATERMVSLVGSLLNVSRLELGTFAIEPVKADLIEVAGVAAREAEPGFAGRKQTFTFTHPEKIAPLLLDPKVTHIVVQNLLSNASKYTPEGGSITLTIKKNAARNGVPGNIEISCSDTGYGIPLAQQGSVFKKLFRADNVRVLDVEGTGLGLYMIKTVVEAAGCSISFVSEENKGTTFKIKIPLTGMIARAGQKTLEDSSK